MIRPQLLKEQLDNINEKEEIIKKMTTVKRTNTEEEVHFERRDKELSLSTEDVTLQPCKIIKILLAYKFFFLGSLIIYDSLWSLSCNKRIFHGKKQ